MKIIDFIKKGNVVRFFLGEDNLKNWYGDDWDDTPYEHNAGTVYDEYVSGKKDIAFPFDALVLEPSEDYSNNGNSSRCKDDMVARKVPCIIVVPKELQDNWQDSFSYYVGCDGILKFYFGDSMEPDT